MQADRKPTKPTGQGKSKTQKTQTAHKAAAPKHPEKKSVRKINPTAQPQIDNMPGREHEEGKLLASEVRYRRLFEAAKDGILILDAGTGEIVDVNPFLIELLGYSHTEFLGKQLWEIGLFKDIVANKSAFLKLQEQRYVRYENLPLETKDGRSIWVEFVSNVYEAGDTRVVQCNIRNITERKRAEEMLKESEERFQNAFEYAAIGKALVAPNGRWIRVNRALVEMLGYSREELLTMTFQDITHPDDLETDLVYVRQMLAGEIQTYQMEKRYLHKQGRVVCALLSVSLVRGKENEPLHFISQIQDITERRQAVEALQKSEEQYRALAEGSPDMIFVIDRDDRVQYVNTFAARQAGTTPENVIGKPRTDLFPPDIAAQQEQSLQRVFESGVPLVSESPLRFGEREMWISNRLVPLRDKLGKVTAVLGVSRDITERKRAEDEIRHLNKFNENLINNMSEGIVVQNTDGEFTFVNPAVSSITGYPPEELIGEHWTKFIPADQHEIIKEADNRRLAGQASQYEIDFLHKSGRRINQLVSGSPLFENERFNGSMAVFTNITERKRVEEAERDQRTLAEALRDTAETLNRTLGFGEVLDHILVSVGRVVPHDSATILLIEEGVLRVARSKGYAERGLPVEQFVSELSLTETTNLRQMFETGKPVLISDTRAYAGWVQVPETSWLRSNLGAPMSIHEEIVGFILLDSGTPDFFTSVHAENLQAFANQAALAIHNARLYQHAQEEITARKQAQEKLRIQLERLSALREIDQTIASTFDLSLSLNTLIAHTTRLLDVDAVSVLLLNSAFNRLEYSVGRGFRDAAIKTTNIKLGESYAGRAVIERRIVEIPNMGDEPNDLFKKGFMKDEKFVSYYGAPLIVKGKVVGVLEVFHRSLVERDLEWHEFFSAMAGQAAIAIDNAKLFENLQISNSDLFQAYDATIEGWSRALDLRDKETEGHTLRVTAKTLELAHIMGLSGDQLVNIRRGALLHDIGKMGVPDHILLKAEDLTEDEWKIMRKHPTFAFELLSPIRYLKSAAIDIPYCHHEKWDGTGYPRGLKGEQIPLAARIFAVLDTWDALTSVRPYRPAWSKEKALAHIRSLAGTHFDPNVVKAFLESELH
ncbi:MAG TPA: PAS domain S-box protein [Anaerolineales bacterium]|nr:PAS domain S-box protein [Anaerolineales bacterium]